MSLYSELSKKWQKQPEEWEAAQKERLIKWRTEGATVRIPAPTRLDRAHSLGYKAKQGVIMVRQRVDRGGRQRPQIRKVRKTSHSRQNKILSKNYQQVAEERAARKFPNMEVLNSYYAGQDGKHYWYEIILVDPESPSILDDKSLSWLATNPASRRRAFRAMTSAGKRRRGLFHKGIGSEKIRPSLRAHNRTK
ncbi:50S ribosomal protein L15e [Candidatus Woesearchaeota archaeon]|nr:50S ribosomal protein L15e [Candidatus Woesearchaeota archaeon]